MEFYDEFETRSEAERGAALVEAVQAQIAHARAKAPGYSRVLADIEIESIVDLKALASIPVTRKSRLLALQGELPPFGGLATTTIQDVARVFQSSGPLYEPEGRQSDYWRFGRALHAAGVRRGDLIHNAFSYHLTPAASMVEGAAKALGCPVFPAGTGQTDLQARAIADLHPPIYTGSPGLLGTIVEKSEELSLDVSSLRIALVSVGGGVATALQEALLERGIALFQVYASPKLGLIAYQSPALEGLICDEGVYVEIVRPGTDQVVPEGEVGEVVVTSLNPLYPLIRYATGDLSAVLPGTSPCGRSNQRISGLIGQADQSTKVNGLFVHPEQIAAVLARHPVLKRARLQVSRSGDKDQMILRCEVGEHEEGLDERVAGSLHDICKLHGEVELLSPGTLPNDGKVIDDRRSIG